MPAPTLFADSNGNLKYVVQVVKYPRAMLSLVLTVSLFITYLLQVTVFKQGNPITPDNHTYDINHVTSRAYDSYCLASKQMVDDYVAFMDDVQGECFLLYFFHRCFKLKTIPI